MSHSAANLKNHDFLMVLTSGKLTNIEYQNKEEEDCML